MIEAVAGGVAVTVWVVPGASSTAVAGRHGDALKVRVAAPPERGRATGAVLDLMSALTGRPASLLSGASSRRKVILLAGADPEEVRQALEGG